MTTESRYMVQKGVTTESLTGTSHQRYIRQSREFKTQVKILTKRVTTTHESLSSRACHRTHSDPATNGRRPLTRVRRLDAVTAEVELHGRRRLGRQTVHRRRHVGQLLRGRHAAADRQASRDLATRLPRSEGCEVRRERSDGAEKADRGARWRC